MFIWLGLTVVWWFDCVAGFVLCFDDLFWFLFTGSLLLCWFVGLDFAVCLCLVCGFV